MDAVLAFVPEEERLKYSAMTGQSLYYLGTTKLKHKVLAIVEEEGASRASYALKLLRAQTRAIHQQQRNRRTLEGLLAQQDREAILALHRNAQRLLQPLAVVNPYADRLSFPDTSARLRRDHEKYLTLIDTIALLHQYQRPVKTLTRHTRVTDYIEVTLADIAQANALAHQVLGRSLEALPPQTRGVLLAIEAWVRERCQGRGLTRERCHFSRRELREALHLGDTQLRLHLNRLADLEYLLVHRGARGACFVYELLYDGQGGDGQPFLPGQIEVEALRAAAPPSAPPLPPVSASAPSPATTPTSRGLSPLIAAPARPGRGADAVGVRAGESPAQADAAALAAASPAAVRETHLSGDPTPGGPYPQAPTPTLSARVLPVAAGAVGQ